MAQFNAKLGRWARKMKNEARAELLEAGELIERHARKHHLSGPRMAPGQTSPNPTIDSKGSLRNSLRHTARVRGSKIRATVEARHGLAKILHDGGVRVARPGRPFVFKLQGRKVVTGRVRIPARPFLSAARKAKMKEVLAKLGRRLTRAYGRS